LQEFSRSGGSEDEKGAKRKTSPGRNSFQEEEKGPIMNMISEPAIPYICRWATPKGIGKRARVGSETTIPPELGKERGTKASTSWADFSRNYFHFFFRLNLGRRLLPFAHESANRFS
jgi:hypothetical protein